MKTMLKTVTLMSVFVFAFAYFTQAQDAKPWTIPAKYNDMKSTVKADDKNALQEGKLLWDKFCKSCHGKDGLGDGPKARMMKTSCGDFSTAAFQKQSDGELYYKSFIGRDEMPNFEKKIPSENDRWALVAYMRTMGK